MNGTQTPPREPGAALRGAARFFRPGMGGDGPSSQDSGRNLLPLVSVENFHILRRRQTADTTDEAKEA
ncbi:hypothetical protein ABZ357_17280 [Streptomyces sp. NPDC005917]|uniref:hypothetical protein n=1 Tax=unclassified Streptomyces TaxID=2593676 RepID=UPI0033F7B332